MRAWALILVVLLVSYGAVGARQPAVRMAVPLPVPARDIADALGIASIDPSDFVVNAVRTLYGMGWTDGTRLQRQNFLDVLWKGTPGTGEMVPLPLDASIWRETLLERDVPNHEIVGAILSTRHTALLYHGLAGLDDETLAWLGAERDTLEHLTKRAGAFSVFGPSIRVHAGRIVVPGGPGSDALWEGLVGVSPSRPAAFVRRLFDPESGYLAWFYDSMAQLDPARRRFALGSALPAASRLERARALLGIFIDSGREWRPEVQPFNRRALDPALTLQVLEVNDDGTMAGPAHRALWERLFNDDGRGQISKGVQTGDDVGLNDTAPIDAGWLLARIHQRTLDIGRRRLQSVLFAQRMFPSARPTPQMMSAIAGYLAYPALMLTLERVGISDLDTLTSSVLRAEALGRIGDDRARRVALQQYQAGLGIMERVARARGLPSAKAAALVRSLAQVETSNRGYEGRLATWVQEDLLPALPPVEAETADRNEDLLLAAMAGSSGDTASLRVVDWEGRQYRVSAARGEALRLRRIRQRQGGLSLTAALTPGEKGDAAVAETLTSILYAAHLGDPEGPALAGGNVAMRHDFGQANIGGSRAAWRLPSEGQGAEGWRVSGSLLGLDVALARMALRRLDAGSMPPEPRLVSAERQTAALSVALSNPIALSDAARDEIAAAVGRGRARLTALDGNRASIEEAARDAGLSAWRRESLAWTAAQDRERLPAHLSLVEIMWLGRPRSTAAIALDGWGAAALPLNGCICLAMPKARPWEPLSGRPAIGLLATRGADVSIRVAEALASLNMPAELATGVIAYAMQEVVDRAQPTYFDDWRQFSHAAAAIPADTLVDFIAAQAAGGALQPARQTSDREP